MSSKAQLEKGCPTEADEFNKQDAIANASKQAISPLLLLAFHDTGQMTIRTLQNPILGCPEAKL
jgi:hypothetical protein